MISSDGVYTDKICGESTDKISLFAEYACVGMPFKEIAFTGSLDYLNTSIIAV